MQQRVANASVLPRGCCCCCRLRCCSCRGPIAAAAAAIAAAAAAAAAAEGGGGAWRVRRVNLHDGVLDERLRAHKLVVRGVVHDLEDAGLPGADLRAPREVARVQAHRAELGVAAAHAHRVHALGADLGHRHLPAHVILPLLVVLGLLAAGQAALVQAVTADTHDKLHARSQATALSRERQSEGHAGTGGGAESTVSASVVWQRPGGTRESTPSARERAG